MRTKSHYTKLLHRRRKLQKGKNEHIYSITIEIVLSRSGTAKKSPTYRNKMYEIQNCGIDIMSGTVCFCYTEDFQAVSHTWS